MIDLSTARGRLAHRCNSWLAAHADVPLEEPNGLQARVAEALAVVVRRPPWPPDSLIADAAHELIALLYDDLADSHERGIVALYFEAICDRYSDQDELAYQILLMWLRSVPSGPVFIAKDLHDFDIDAELSAAGWWPG